MTTDKPSNLNTRFDIHICLVSGQPTPNLTPVLASGWKPETAVLIVSPQQENQAKWLQEVFKRHHVKCEIERISDAFNIREINTILENLVKEKYAGKSVAFNVTGGTKPMAIAAQAAAFYNDCPYFYVNHSSNEIQIHTPQEDFSDIPVIKLTLKDYLNVHGYEMQPKPSFDMKYSPAKALRDNLVKDANLFSKAIGNLNWLAHKAETVKSLEVEVPEHILKDENFNRILDDFIGKGLVSLRGNLMTFTDEDARTFANGGWLEDHVYDIIRKISPQDFGKNIKINNSRFGSENELDVIFLAKNRLHLIECKTKKFDEDGEKGRDTLYKLDSLSELGGLNTKGMLVSYRELDEHTRRRAKDLQIKVIDASQLMNLENQIRTWISQ